MNSTVIDLITKKNKSKIHTVAVTNQTPIKDAYLEKYVKKYKTVNLNILMKSDLMWR